MESAETEDATNNALDFDMDDFGEFNSKTEQGLIVNSATLSDADEASFGNTMPALDMPSFEAPKFMPDALTDAAEAVADNVLDLSELMPETDEFASFNDLATDSIEFPPLDTPATDAEFDKEAVLDISGMESELTSADFNSSTDFNFDIPTIAPDNADYIKDDDNALEANVFDLNTINLEMDDGAGSVERPVVSAYTVETDVEAPVELNSSSSEPIEVETKLDLVAAYIEMDDKEGAKELLEEVMQEGGAGQRKRAEALIAQLA